MLIGSILELDLSKGVKHLQTSWQISDKQDFSNILVESLNDSVNLTSIVFPDLSVDVNTQLYGRARILTDIGGWSAFNNLDIVTTDSDEDIFTLPCKISVPRLYTSKYGSKATRQTEDDLTFTNHPLTLFYISNDESYTVIGDAIHNASSWWIEDLDGNVVWKSLKDSINLNIILVDDIILERDSIYVIKHIMHTNTNDSSDIVSYRIRTLSMTNNTLYAYFENALNNLPSNYSNGFTLTIPYDAGVNNVWIEIYVNSNDRLSRVYQMQLENGERHMPVGVDIIQPSKLYTIFFKTKATDQFDCLTFSTFNQS